MDASCQMRHVCRVTLTEYKVIPHDKQCSVVHQVMAESQNDLIKSIPFIGFIHQIPLEVDLVECSLAVRELKIAL